MASDRKICVGMIAGVHGVRGLVRLRSFTDEPEAILDYEPLKDEKGKSYSIELKSVAKDHFIAAVKGITTKEQADELRGTKLFVPREALPKTRKREFYEVDLKGLAAKDKDGRDYGQVQGVHNYGAGPFLEIGEGKGSFMLPFTDACVPTVDLKAGEVTIAVPEGWL